MLPILINKIIKILNVDNLVNDDSIIKENNTMNSKYFNEQNY